MWKSIVATAEESGKDMADLILTNGTVHTPADRLMDVKVLMTIVGGKVVHDGRAAPPSGGTRDHRSCMVPCCLI